MNPKAEGLLLNTAEVLTANPDDYASGHPVPLKIIPLRCAIFLLTTIIKTLKNQGKGNKDRITIFSKTLLADLHAYYKTYRPKVYLFEGKIPGKPMSNGAMQVAVRNAMTKAGFEKGKYSAHSCSLPQT